MAEFDLIPKEYAQTQLLRRRVKGFAIALASMLVIVALAWLGLALATQVESAKVARLQKEGQISAQARAKADEYRAQKLTAEKQLSALDELRGRDRVMLLLSAIDAAYLNGVWFDEIRYFRGEALPTRSLNALPGDSRAGIIVVPKEPAPGSAPQASGIEQHVELSGHALNHSVVAQFMRALGSRPGIADVRLLDTGLRNYARVQVIDFKLSLLVDEKAGRRQ